MNIIEKANLMKGGDSLLQSERTAIAQALLEAVEVIESMQWITSYEDGGPDTCKADRTKARAFLEKVKA